MRGRVWALIFLASCAPQPGSRPLVSRAEVHAAEPSRRRVAAIAARPDVALDIALPGLPVYPWPLTEPPSLVAADAEAARCDAMRPSGSDAAAYARVWCHGRRDTAPARLAQLARIHAGGGPLAHAALVDASNLLANELPAAEARRWLAVAAAPADLADRYTAILIALGRSADAEAMIDAAPPSRDPAVTCQRELRAHALDPRYRPAHATPVCADAVYAGRCAEALADPAVHLDDLRCDGYEHAHPDAAAAIEYELGLHAWPSGIGIAGHCAEWTAIADRAAAALGQPGAAEVALAALGNAAVLAGAADWTRQLEHLAHDLGGPDAPDSATRARLAEVLAEARASCAP